jgi:hypothetical protein
MFMTNAIRLGTLALAVLGTVGIAIAQAPSPAPRATPGAPGLNQGANTGEKVQLSAAQKTAIFIAVSKDKSKVASPPPANFRASIGAQVPASIELYALPPDALASAQAASNLRYTMANNEVVLVDPLNLRVVDIIRQ